MRHNPKQENVNRNTYIPEHVRVQMEKQLQRNLPGHLKQYAGAYMQQQVMDPSMRGGASRPMQSGAPPPTYHPVTHLPRDQHYVQYKNGTAVPRPESPPTEINTSTGQQPVSPEQAYDFIVNPEVAPQKRSLLPANSSLPVKIAIFGGGFILLMILFVVIKGLFAGNSAAPAYVSVIQDQQEIIHLLANPQQVSTLPTNTQNFIATANMSITTSQGELIGFLAKSGKKIKPKELILKVDKSADNQLAAATIAATYDQTFKQVVTSKFTPYMRDLQQAYQQSGSETGKSLLNNQFNQAKLLLIQLDATKS